ncbi:dihydropteroate synthase [Aquabacter sp. CN5-332]|uniref:dihydropteroate synthase n=1 Tax=Aquabacter sp. CN5-332 TaxID=3156608 RepID=UPI0032B44D94
MGAAPARVIEACDRRLTLGPRTLVMGILNVTPDSFSDGGLSATPEDAVANGRHMAAEGADILDVGGESTRPGHTPVPADQEWARVAPVIKALARDDMPPVSIDTWKAEVAAKAVMAGAVIINDVWGLTRDTDMARVIADTGAAAVLMHNRETIDGTLDIVQDMLAFFKRALEKAEKAGVKRERIVLDPGIGFGKTFEQNLSTQKNLSALRALDQPLLLGTSRKSFIGRIIETTTDERLPGTIASNAIGILAGVEIIRVHDVAAHIQAARVTEAIRDAQ